MNNSYHLIASCPDQSGIVAQVSGFIAKHGGDITEATQHSCQTSRWFFMRYEIDANSLSVGLDQLKALFSPLAQSLNMQFKWYDARIPKKVAVLVSRQDHCLRDLLYRYQSEALPCEIACVISNHDNLRDCVEWHDTPYHPIAIEANQGNQQKAAAFDELFQLIQQYQIDTLVLARFMQIIPAHFCKDYAGRIINIHHSFLPSFMGAKPYEQAYQQGVKLIGATCHYVTDELDKGPIIEQDIIRVSHADDVARLTRKGRDVEKTVLARGLRYHLENRVIVHNNKTIVFI